MVFGSPPVRRYLPRNHSRLLETAQPLCQQRARYPRQTALQLVEVADAKQHFPHYERCPTISKDLRRFRYWTGLAVDDRHNAPFLRRGARIKSIIRTRLVPGCPVRLRQDAS